MTDTTMYKQVFSVSFEYPVIFSRDLFNPSNPALADAVDRLKEPRVHPLVCFIDSGVAERHHDLIEDVQSYAAAYVSRLQLVMSPQIVPGGERVKNDAGVIQLMLENFAALGLSRHSGVLAVGGGAVLDAVGFAAGLFHRGLRVVRVPTTVLAQNDVGVGVKNAVNFLGGKNTIGLFAPPFAVLNDFLFLRTLSDRNWIGGVSEAFKVAIIRDAEFFGFLCANAGKFRMRDEAAMEHLIRRCAELHLEHIRTSGDPFEFGKARPLDFGHWAAHKLEALSLYRIGHGHAVAAGIALDACYAGLMGWITPGELESICRGLQECGFKLWYDEMGQRTEGGALEILGGLRDFQLHLGGELHVTFPTGIGSSHEVREIDAERVEESVKQLERLKG